jgi:hypothetical protein
MAQSPIPVVTETMQCPLCLGAGELKRTEVLDRLGVKDFARVAQLSAEEAFRLLQQKQNEVQQSVWARFESELAKRTAEISRSHQSELHTLITRVQELESATSIADERQDLEFQRVRAGLEDRLRIEQSQRADLNRRTEDYLREVSELRDRNQELEAEMSKVARVGKREELAFADEARTWAGICISEKLSRNGDFILAYRDLSGAPLEPRMLIDCKDKLVISETDISKLVRDARERSISVGVLVAKHESQLRQIDKDCRWDRKENVWILRTTREWLPRDLDVLKPLFERMRTQGSDFLDKNVALADEVRRTFADLDRIEAELKKASKAITSASGSLTKYRSRLQSLCDTTAQRIASQSEINELSLAQAGD